MSTHSILRRSTVVLLVCLCCNAFCALAAMAPVSAEVIKPNLFGVPLSVSPTSLSGFSTVEGKPSATKKYTVTVSAPTGSNTSVSVLVAMPFGYEARIAGSSSKFADKPGIGTFGPFTLEIRLKGNVAPGTYNGKATNSTAGATMVSVSLSGTVLPKPTPTVNPGSLSGFSIVQGTLATAQDAQSFKMTMSGLSTANGTPFISIKAPEGYLVGLSSNPFAFVKALGLQAFNGRLSATIFVRLDGNKAGTFNGNVTISGNQIITKNVPVSGIIKPKPLVATQAARSDASLSEEAVVQVKAFPNPVESILTVEYAAMEGEVVTIRLLDEQGQTLKKVDVTAKGGVEQVEMWVEEPQAGLYLLEVVTPQYHKKVQILKR